MSDQLECEQCRSIPYYASDIKNGICLSCREENENGVPVLGMCTKCMMAIQLEGKHEVPLRGAIYYWLPLHDSSGRTGNDAVEPLCGHSGYNPYLVEEKGS